VKSDDSSLEPEQLLTVRASARLLLDKGGAWGTLPTPVDQLMDAAGLKLAPISAFDESSMQRFLREAGEKAAHLLKGAVEKVLGIFDVHADLVHIDHTLYKDKQTFLKLHETGHKELPHQRGLFKWIQDCSKHLDPRTVELFEREANTFASIVLFQDDAFAKHTLDEPFGIKVPMAAAKKFGSSLYAAFREYVRKHHKICAVLALEPTTQCPSRGPIAEVRRIEQSPSFQAMFNVTALFPGEITMADDLFRLIPFRPQRMTRPRSFFLVDRNGDRHEFVGEGFRSGYHTIILIHAVGSLNAKRLIS
jgi:hypothetical protein